MWFNVSNHMNKDMKYYYIYLIKFETGEVYVGSRQSKVPPEQDTKYWGSPVTYKHLWEDVNLKKEKFIIKECESIEKARALEVKLIKNAWKKYSTRCLNRCASTGFHPDVCSKAGKKSKQLGIGIFGLSKEERIKNGKKTYELGLGIHGLSKEERIEHGKKSKHLGLGVHGLSKEERIKVNQKIGEKNSKKFKIKSPTGEIVEGKNIREFCRIHNLDFRNMSSVILGKRKSHKGWTLP